MKGVPHQLANASQANPDRFKIENRRLSQLAKTSSVTSPIPRHTLLEGVWIDYQRDAEVDVRLGPTEDHKKFRITVDDIGRSAYFSLSYDIDMNEIDGTRYFGISLDASGKGLPVIWPCLRYHFKHAFKDSFFSRPLVLGNESTGHLSYVRVNEPDLRRSRNVEALLFVNGRKYMIEIETIKNFHA